MAFGSLWHGQEPSFPWLWFRSGSPGRLRCVPRLPAWRPTGLGPANRGRSRARSSGPSRPWWCFKPCCTRRGSASARSGQSWRGLWLAGAHRQYPGTTPGLGRLLRGVGAIAVHACSDHLQTSDPHLRKRGGRIRHGTAWGQGWMRSREVGVYWFFSMRTPGEFPVRQPERADKLAGGRRF